MTGQPVAPRAARTRVPLNRHHEDRQAKEKVSISPAANFNLRRVIVQAYTAKTLV